MDAREPKCAACFDGVCREPKLLDSGEWRLGEDARYHWRQLYAATAVCGARVLADSGARFLYD